MNTLFLIMLLVFVAAGILAVLILGAMNNFAEMENQINGKSKENFEI